MPREDEMGSWIMSVFFYCGIHAKTFHGEDAHALTITTFPRAFDMLLNFCEKSSYFTDVGSIPLSILK